jgi:hypothetical protein
LNGLLQLQEPVLADADAFEPLGGADDFSGTGSGTGFDATLPNQVRGFRRRRMKAMNRIGRVACRQGEILGREHCKRP